MRKRNYIILFIMVFTFLYWIKSQFYINIFESFSLSEYYPFSLLKNDDSPIIGKSHFGILVDESFNSPYRIMEWPQLWMENEGTVNQEFVINSIDESKCLLIINNTAKSWSYTNKYLIEVNNGDIFGFAGYLKKNSIEVQPAISIITYNMNKEVLKWNFVKEGISEINKWTHIRKNFAVGKDVLYIRFRLIGRGKGNCWFDNLKLFR